MPKPETRDPNFEELESRVSAAISAADPADFDGLAIEVFRFQRAFNPAYGQYCRALEIPDSPPGWRQIPALPQAAFKLAPLRAFPAEAEVAEFHTSGTTGTGHGVHHFRSLRLYDQAILRGWDRLGLPRLPQISLIPRPGDARHSSLSHMIGRLESRALGGEHYWCIRQDGGLDAERLWGLLRTFEKRPVLLFGTALSFLHLFERMEERSFHLAPGSLAFETGGYKGTGRALSKESLYGKFARRIGIAAEDVINEYGMTELSSQSYTRGLGRPHEAPPWMRAIAVSPATGHEVADGETGVLRIYDLANVGSVLAVQTRDLAIRRGDDFELLGRDPAALPRGCSRSADEVLSAPRP